MTQVKLNKYTKWYLHTRKPFYSGVYQVQDAFGIDEYAIFDENTWYKLGKMSESQLCMKIITVESHSTYPSMDCIWFKWRGLTDTGYSELLEERENLLDKQQKSSLYSKFIKWIKGNK